MKYVRTMIIDIHLLVVRDIRNTQRMTYKLSDIRYRY